MAVAPSHRRRGAARALLAAAETLARRWRQPSLWLHVAGINTTAQALYQSAGFTVAVAADGSARGGGWNPLAWLVEPWKQLLMSKALPPPPSAARVAAPWLALDGAPDLQLLPSAALPKDAAAGSSGTDSSVNGSSSGGGGSGGAYMWSVAPVVPVDGIHAEVVDGDPGPVTRC